MARLELDKVIRAACAIPWDNRRAFARALAIPFVLTVLLEPAWRLIPTESPQRWGLYLLLCLHSLIYTVFAVICHRLVLLGTNDEVSRLLPRWSWRETRFLLWCIGLWGGVMMFTVGIGFSVTFTLLRQSENHQFPWPPWAFYLAMVPAFYVFARSALVFPATAVDAKAGLAWSWKLTRGNGWRLALLVGLLPLAIGVLTRALVGKDPGGLVNFALTCIHNVVLVVEIAVLSVSYRHLTSGETPHPV